MLEALLLLGQCQFTVLLLLISLSKAILSVLSSMKQETQVQSRALSQ